MGDVIEMPGASERREKLADLEKSRLDREGLEKSRLAEEVRRRIEERPRPSGPGSQAERARVAEALFHLQDRVKLAGRGSLRRVIDRVNPQAGNGYLHNFVLSPNLPPEQRSKRIARLRKDLRIYRRIAEAMAVELRADKDRVIAEVFEATSYAGAADEASDGLDEVTVRITSALRFIVARVAERQGLASYFADLQRHNVVAVDRTAAELTDSDTPGFGGGYRPHHAWPRVDLFHELILESEAEIEEWENCPRPSDRDLRENPLRPMMRYLRRVSLVVAPAAEKGSVQAMFLLQPTTALFRGGAAWHWDPFWVEGRDPEPSDNGGVATNRHGHNVGYSLPDDFDLGKAPYQGHPGEDLAELLLVTPQSVDRLFREAMNELSSQLEDYLARWQDIPTLAPKQTALSRLESKILATDRSGKDVCELEGDLERDCIRRVGTFRKWQQNAISQGETAWEHRLAQLAERNS